MDVSPANNGLQITVHAGGYVTDVATLTPSSATGTVTFKYYPASPTVMPTLSGTTAGMDRGGLGFGELTPTQFNTTGTFYWRVFFTGSGSSLNSTSICNEILTVRQTQISTSPSVYPNDSATITVANGAGPTGNVVFSLYDTKPNCDAGLAMPGRLFTETVALAAGAALSKSVNTHNGDPGRIWSPTTPTAPTP